MKPDAKTVGKRGDAATRKEMADLRAELDDFVNRVPTLSQTELNQAKEKLIQKLASTTGRAGSPFRSDVRKRNDLSKIFYGIVGATAAALLMILRRPARDYYLARDYGHASDNVQTRRCARLESEKECNDKPPCAWCPQYKRDDGSTDPARCCNTADIYDVCMRN